MPDKLRAVFQNTLIGFKPAEEVERSSEKAKLQHLKHSASKLESLLYQFLSENQFNKFSKLL